MITISEYGLLVDIKRCVGCRACEIACKQENDIPEGMQWIKMIKVGPEEINGKLIMDFVPLSCLHCGEPPCVDVCPVKAISKRPDGIVLIDETKCIGCKLCLWSCPFGAPQFDPESGIVQKCKMCAERVEKGLEPACVRTCPLKALKFGTIEELSEYKRKKVAKAVIYVPTIQSLKSYLGGGL